MSWVEALLLGIIQGLTEFLPVSSSGHLEIMHHLFGTASEGNLFFAIVVHCATVLSTLTVFRKELAEIFKGTFSTVSWNDQKEYCAKILLSLVPIMVVGLFFKDEVEDLFGSSLLLVGIGLLITATLLFVSERINKRRNGAGHTITYGDSFIVGLAQTVAILPGLSRSGTTIATGLLCGVKKEEIAQFSFLMVIIPVLGEAFLDLVDILRGTLEVAFEWGVLLVGFISAYIVGCLACKFMIRVVSKQKLTYFALYCCTVGLTIVILTLV